jgi:hypothetical protein
MRSKELQEDIIEGFLFDLEQANFWCTKYFGPKPETTLSAKKKMVNILNDKIKEIGSHSEDRYFVKTLDLNISIHQTDIILWPPVSATELTDLCSAYPDNFWLHMVIHNNPIDPHYQGMKCC